MMKRLLAIGALLIVLGLAMLGIGAAHDGLQPIAVVTGNPLLPIRRPKRNRSNRSHDSR